MVKMVAPGRFELPTSGLGNRCSIHLSYGAKSQTLMILKVLAALFKSFSNLFSTTENHTSFGQHHSNNFAVSFALGFHEGIAVPGCRCYIGVTHQLLLHSDSRASSFHHRAVRVPQSVPSDTIEPQHFLLSEFVKK